MAKALVEFDYVEHEVIMIIQEAIGKLHDLEKGTGGDLGGGFDLLSAWVAKLLDLDIEKLIERRQAPWKRVLLLYLLRPVEGGC